MEVALSDAKARLTDLVRRAEAGDDVVLTRHGRRAVRLVPVDDAPASKAMREHRRKLLDDLIAAARAAGPYRGPPAERATDFLYDENGLPG